MIAGVDELLRLGAVVLERPDVVQHRFASGVIPTIGAGLGELNAGAHHLEVRMQETPAGGEAAGAVGLQSANDQLDVLLGHPSQYPAARVWWPACDGRASVAHSHRSQRRRAAGGP